ncbi:hypothetical protein VPH35_003393 [Triticum aestivum]|nr:uncharacterized protein LOC123151745 [Triticum aestivum]
MSPVQSGTTKAQKQRRILPSARFQPAKEIPACRQRSRLSPLPASQPAARGGGGESGSTMMWGIAAAVASAAAVAVASGAELLACDRAPTPPTAAAVVVGRCDGFLFRQRESSSSSGRDDRFAPRFDGLRFVETLVTAHR